MTVNCPDPGSVVGGRLDTVACPSCLAIIATAIIPGETLDEAAERAVEAARQECPGHAAVV